MVFTVANGIAPSVVALLGARSTMIAASITYLLFIAQPLILHTYLLYAASALLGVGKFTVFLLFLKIISRTILLSFIRGLSQRYP